MEILIIVIFLIGYLGIAFEHPLKIDKAAPALLLGILTWAVYAVMGDFHGDPHGLDHELNHHLPEIMNILFFLLGAMTIVELIDIHEGFQVITSRINTTSKSTMLWIICVITFFMSATLDNLTTAIVMASLIGKLLKDRPDRLMYASMVIIAANAGGAWSPIGDVTTTMLWIGGCLSVSNMIPHLIIPSLVCMIVPAAVLSFKMRGQTLNVADNIVEFKTTSFERRTMLTVGVAGLVFVPVFKTATHLPPFMGMMLSLGVVWLVAELLHKNKTATDKRYFSPFHALAKIDAASILFFFGILIGVACLSSIDVLTGLAGWLDKTIGNIEVITLVIGILSSIVDNVPLVAAAMKMYSVDAASEYYAMDGKFWEFLAYCAGTGGSMLVIGSAAGVAIMGIEKIEFFWYMKNFSLLALLGYFSGAIVYLLMYPIF